MVRITGKTADDSNTRNVEIVMPFKYLSNCWRMPLINSELNVTLTW